jgi:hypothetical protein
MPKPVFGEHGKKRQKELCLEYAAELRDGQNAPATPSAITRLCMERNLFADDQLEFYRFEGARRQVERWLKTRDDSGLELWAQIPFTDSEGEMFWEQRREMTVTGYAWNYLLRDDLVERNIARRERWRDEAEARFGIEDFSAEVERLRVERRRNAA